MNTMVKIEDLKKLPVSELPTTIRAEAFYKGTFEIEKFISSTALKVFSNLISPSKKENAVIASYFSLYCWLDSVVAMNKPKHFQSVMSASRSMFELLLDINLLVYDALDNGIEKFYVFNQIERFRVAGKIVKYKELNHNTNLSVARQKALVSTPEKCKEIDDLREKYYGRNKNDVLLWPKHWTGLDVRARAQRVDSINTSHCKPINYEEMYCECYPMQSWYIHSGSVGYEGLSADQIEEVLGYSHHIIQTCMLNSTTIVGIYMHLDKAMEKFFKIIDQLELVPGAVLVEEQIKLLENASK